MVKYNVVENWWMQNTDKGELKSAHYSWPEKLQKKNEVGKLPEVEGLQL